MERLITYYEACTTIKCCLALKQDNTFTLFYHTGECQLTGTYKQTSINQCDFYILDKDIIFAINNHTGCCIFIDQYSKYTYIGSVYTKKIETTKIKTKKDFNLSLCAIALNENDRDDSIIDFNTVLKSLKAPYEVIVLDYYKNITNTQFKVFQPTHFIKKITAVNAVIDEAVYDTVLVTDSRSKIDLKFLAESFSLDDNTLLIPNIIHRSADIHPLAMHKKVFKKIGGLNEDIAIEHFTINTVLKCLILDVYIKAYPTVLGKRRIRGNFKNFKDDEKQEAISCLKDNIIYSLRDIETLGLQDYLNNKSCLLNLIK